MWDRQREGKGLCDWKGGLPMQGGPVELPIPLIVGVFPGQRW